MGQTEEVDHLEERDRLSNSRKGPGSREYVNFPWKKFHFGSLEISQKELLMGRIDGVKTGC